MKSIYSIACFLLLVPFAIFCQDSQYHQSYFENLKQELSRNSDIREIKLYQKKYLNGNIKEQEMYVKYANDTINRYWIVGKAYS